jgi:RNA polymerase sigma-70 factor, ECF subfamily
MAKPVLEVLPGGGSAESRAALRDLYSQYGGSVFGRCSYLLKDRSKAEDAMQDVFAKALAHLGEFRSEASPLTWLMKIATHHCLNLLRAERAPWHQSFRRQEESRGEAHGGPQLFEDREAVRQLLGRCDLETQAAAVHYYVDEMTLEEVAALLGRSVPTIRKRLESFARPGGGDDVKENPQ